MAVNRRGSMIGLAGVLAGGVCGGRLSACMAACCGAGVTPGTVFTAVVAVAAGAYLLLYNEIEQFTIS